MAKHRIVAKFCFLAIAFSLVLVLYWIVDARSANARTFAPPTARRSGTSSSSSSATPTVSWTPHVVPSTTRVVSSAPPVNPFVKILMGAVSASDLTFYQCALDRFQYNGPPEEIIPVGIVPLTIERQLFRTLMCNMTVSFRHLIVIVNGWADDVADDMKALEKLLPKDHFHVYWRPEITSFSGCVNMGFEFAMRLPFEEAPYVTVFNSDTRYSANYLNRFARHVRETVMPDKELLEKLTREVEDEVVAAKNENRTTLRTLQLKGLSQSTALPDRLRYGDPKIMRSVFANHTSVFTHAFRTMCSFAVSRLAIAAVGMYDENYFPAYGEDYDWVGRADLIGFKHWEPGDVNPFGSFQHILNGMLGTVGIVANRTSASFLLGLSLRNMIDLWMIHRYSEVKWEGSSGTLYSKPYLKFKNSRPFQSTGLILPLDAWVLDETAINRIKALGFGYIDKTLLTKYNMSLLAPLNVSHRNETSPQYATRQQPASTTSSPK